MVTRREIIGGIAGILAARQCPAMMLGAQGMFYRSKHSAVRLDWISSDGNCGIVTDYLMHTEGTRVETTVNYNNNAGGFWYSVACVATTSSTGADSGDYSFSLCNPYNINNQLIWIWWDNGIWNCRSGAASQGVWHDISVYKNSTSAADKNITLSMDGSSVTMSWVGWTSIEKKPAVYPLTFFCRLPVGRTVPTSYFNLAKVRRFAVYSDHSGTTALADFVPVLNGDGEPGLLDTVTRKFYGKVGSGSLLHGDPIGSV